MLGIAPAQLIARVIVLVIAFTVHEFAHAWSANQLGDDTPRLNGRLTLNPLAHLDPIGSLLLLVAGFGWAKPVPVNPYAVNRTTPLGLMWVSLAGPFSNFLMAILAAIPLRMDWVTYSGFTQNGFPSLFELLYYFVQINLVLMLFNLIPIAPLDGSKIAVAILPDSWAQVVERISMYGPIVLMVLIFLGPQIGIDPIGWVLNPVMSNLIRLLIGA